jgi:hypothetical protein
MVRQAENGRAQVRSGLSMPLMAMALKLQTTLVLVVRRLLQTPRQFFPTLAPSPGTHRRAK